MVVPECSTSHRMKSQMRPTAGIQPVWVVSSKIVSMACEGVDESISVPRRLVRFAVCEQRWESSPSRGGMPHTDHLNFDSYNAWQLCPDQAKTWRATHKRVAPGRRAGSGPAFARVGTGRPYASRGVTSEQCWPGPEFSGRRLASGREDNAPPPHARCVAGREGCQSSCPKPGQTSLTLVRERNRISPPQICSGFSSSGILPDPRQNTSGRRALFCHIIKAATCP
jgi:hypothetical protein